MKPWTILLIVLTLAGLARAGSVTLKTAAVLRAGADAITLADVASLDVPGENLAATLSGAELGLTPGDADASGVIEVTRRDVEKAVEAAGVRRSLVAINGDTLALRLHPRDARRVRTAVESAPREEDPDWQALDRFDSAHPVLEAVLNAVHADQGLARDHVRVRLDRPTLNRLETLPIGDRFSIDRVSTPNSSRGVFRVTTFDANDRPEKPFTVAMDIEVRLSALVLTREVRRGQPVSAMDYESRPIWRGPAAVDLLTLEGTASLPLAKTRLEPGTVLTTVNTAPPVLVAKRQAVRVFAHTDGITVRVDAVALEDGTLGDLVRCRPISIRKARGDEGVFLARVTGSGELTFADSTE